MEDVEEVNRNLFVFTYESTDSKERDFHEVGLRFYLRVILFEEDVSNKMFERNVSPLLRIYILNKRDTIGECEIHHGENNFQFYYRYTSIEF